MIRTARAAVAGDPRTMMRVHKYLTFAWLALIPPILLTDAKDSVAVVVVISIYANVVGHWSSWQAAKAERKVDQLE